MNFLITAFFLRKNITLGVINVLMILIMAIKSFIYQNQVRYSLFA